MLSEHPADEQADFPLGPEQFTAEHRPASVVIALTGEFDDFNAKHLRQCLGEQLVDQLRSVDLDTARVTYLSSTAMRALITFHDEATAAGAKVRIVRASYVVRRLLDVVGLAAMFGLAHAAELSRSTDVVGDDG